MSDKIEHAYALIMAGGIGSRFWPLSKTKQPKQFLDILGMGKTLLQQSYDRLTPLFPPENIFVSTQETFADMARRQLHEMIPSSLVLEPMRKNTAPCIAYMAFKLAAIDPNAVLVVCPSDHLILDEKDYRSILQQAVDYASGKDALITLGIRPTRPDTGYGYIQYVDDEPVANSFYKVKVFVEKPSLEIAKAFLASGDFLWNAGIFIWNVKSILKAFQHLLPDMFELFNENRRLFNTPKEYSAIKNIYSLCPNLSIDHGILEKSKNVYVIPAHFGWSDLGTWASLYESHAKDFHGNSVTGKNVDAGLHTQNCMIHISDHKLAVIHDLEGYIVVDTDDILLICRLDKEQEIKQIVAEVRRTKGEKYL